MRQKDLKYFGDIQSGRMNSDDSPFSITTNEWVNAQNVRTGTTDKGVVGVVESIGGNVEIPKPADLASVVIGDQKWSLQNLSVTKYRDGSDVPLVADPTAWAALTTGARCINPANGETFYNWYAVNDPRGLAPQGWWIPTLYEFQQLSNYLGGDSVSGGKLKEEGFVHWDSPNTGADNSSGFTALGSGYRDIAGDFQDNKLNARFWTATEYSPTSANTVLLRYDQAIYDTNLNIPKTAGYSVRAITFNSQYITIGSIEDTENNRFVYFDYDQNRDNLAPIVNITLLGSLLPGVDNSIFTFDSRASVLKAGDTIYIVNGTTASFFTIESITITEDILYPGSYRIILSSFFAIDDTFTTDILYTIGGEDKIVCMYTDTNIQYNVLTSSQVIGGLNFDKNSLIHSAHIANNILSWTDGTNNEPRKINIESAIKANYSSFVTDSHTYLLPIDFSQITLIKPTAIYPPAILKNVLGTENFIFNDSFGFAYQYQYYDSETTVIGMYSVSTRINGKDDPYNNIVVTMDFTNIVPDNVKVINLIARGSDSNYAFIAKSWNKKNPDDLNDIDNHNNQIGQLTYNFNNTITGIVIAESDVLRPFDNVPIYSQTHEIAKQRYFLANNIDGYDAPLNTSMELSIGSYVSPSGTSQTSTVYLFRFGDVTGTIYAYAAWVMYLPWATTPGYYLVNGSDNLVLGSPPVPFTFPLPLIPAPTTVSLAALTYKGATINEYVINTKPSGTYATPSILQTLFNSTITVTSTTLPYYNAFPQISSYKSGIAFYDFAMRKCSVVTNNNCVVSTPQRDYNYTSAVDSFAWNLTQVPVDSTEIPDWAYYYAPIITKNQTKRFFIESFTNAAKYASRDASGNYVYNNTFTAANTVAIALPADALNQAGLGYVYSDGDICILTKSDDTYSTLPVIGQDSNYILIKPTDLGTLTSVNFVYEIYTQYKTSEQEPFYEVGQILKILNPKTSARSYSQLSGFFNADAYIFQRTFNTIGYISSAMSPNDLYYKNWYTDTGKVNVISRIGQVDNNTEVLWSDTYISGTQVNGSSTFRLGSQTFVSDDCGSITKLQNTSKVQDQGSVMLALCAVETNSMYLGETQITDSTGGVQFFSAGTDVVGTINILKGNYGCIDPASVVQYRGNVYFLDASNGRWVQYSANGLDTISAIKMARFWKNWCYRYMSLTKDEIEAFGNRPYVFATVDPSHDELLITIPKLSNVPPKGFLPDYPLVVYPFDILDYQGKTISYKLGTGAVVQPHWQSAYSFNTEYFCTIQNRLFTFNEGNAWEHNQDNQNVFFGVYSPSQIMFTSNILPQMPKVYDNFLSESNIVPNFVYFYNEFPYLQTSDLEDISFVQKEGIWYAQILRNKVVPTTSGDVYTGLLTAEVMRNTNMFVLAEYSPTTSPLQLRILELGMSISKGHIV
tara:strand:- start:20031 stop:24269 length:4239 start_codon:yes stop_codon:yes gene_type:complete